MAKISAGVELTVEPAVDDIFPIVDISEAADADKRKKIKWSTIKTVLKAIYDALYAPIANGVTTGDSHAHTGGAGAQIAYSSLSGLPTYVNFVDRGDPADYDYVVGDFTTNGSWHDLDLSSIVPSGAKAIILRVAVVDDTVNVGISFRKNGNTNAYNFVQVLNQVTNLTMDGQVIVFCDANRVIEYLASNTTFTAINLLVVGWII